LQPTFLIRENRYGGGKEKRTRAIWLNEGKVIGKRGGKGDGGGGGERGKKRDILP